MSNTNLESGGDAGSIGAVRKSYDKYGKRMYTAVSRKVAGALNATHKVVLKRLKVFSK